MCAANSNEVTDPLVLSCAAYEPINWAPALRLLAHTARRAEQALQSHNARVQRAECGADLQHTKEARCGPPGPTQGAAALVFEPQG